MISDVLLHNSLYNIFFVVDNISLILDLSPSEAPTAPDTILKHFVTILVTVVVVIGQTGHGICFCLHLMVTGLLL